jgi:hypothetical protein
MNEEPDRQAADAPAPEAPPQPTRPVDASVCLCAGLGPLLTQALRTLTVPDEVKRTVHETEREALRLLRTLIEMRLSSLGPDGPPQAQTGTKISVS